MGRKKVLILVNEKQILEILTFAIGREGYEIIRLLDGTDGIDLAASRKPDIIVLDLASSLDNTETCHSLWRIGITAPIIILVGKDDVHNINFYLKSGAGKCIKKPFAMKELLLLISDILRYEGTVSGNEVVSLQRHLGRIVIDLERVLVTKDDVAVDLTKQEYDVLNLLSSEPGRVFSREELMHQIWNYTGYLGDVRSVDVAVRRLREKIEDNPAHPKIIITRRGRGYLFVQQ